MGKQANGRYLAFLEAAASATTDECIEPEGWSSRPTWGGKINASRKVWLIAHGTTNGLNVLHTCDNFMCVNIRHLYLGDQRRNSLDAFERQRRTTVQYVHGERCHTSRMTATDVVDVRRRYAAGGISQQALADQYGVSQVNISQIVRRRSWQHVP